MNNDPVAIVGMGCRFPPDIGTPAGFWEFLCSGGDAVSPIPSDRWNVEAYYDDDPAAPGKMRVKNGAFIRDFDMFDPSFFGVSPREAAVMDPQQRLLLETTWNALEDAGHPPLELRGSDTAVYVGGFSLDYKLLQISGLQRELIGMHTSAGAAATMLSNRLSYMFDFHGPSMTIDTACSSSMVALAMACEALRSGRCSMALAGGVTIIFKPEWTIGTSKGGFLSPDGRCKTFDASADGYGRGEGCAVLVLKPLSQALEDDDRVYALVKSAVINQDGATQGITVPNPDAQVKLMRIACVEAGIEPVSVDYVEAHGTGTPTGDPVEAKALGRVFGSGAGADRACPVGSVKTNIGHLEAAAGVAGVMKAALCLYRSGIPASLHFRNPNPAIPFDKLGLRVVTALEPIESNGQVSHALVNSFGFGGTNACAVLSSFPPGTGRTHHESESAIACEKTPELLVLSANDDRAGADMIRAWIEFLGDCDRKGTAFHDICYTAGVRRTHRKHRITLPASSCGEAARLLKAYLDGESSDLLTVTPSAGLSRQGRLAFVFSGMGPQWWNMGAELFRTVPEYRAALERVEKAWKPVSGWSLLQELAASEEKSRMNRADIGQPAIFALQVGLIEVWRSLGIEPEAVTGHSLGELTAAYASGALTLEDAVTLAYHRSRLQQTLAGRGGLLVTGLNFGEAQELCAEHENRVCVAAVNSPFDVTLSGDTDVLKKIAAIMEDRHIFCRSMKVDIPYHGPAIDDIRDELLASSADIKPVNTALDFYSTVTATVLPGTALGADYWFRNLREPVNLAMTIERMVLDGFEYFVEVGPHQVLCASIQGSLAAIGRKGCVVPSLRRKEPEHACVLAGLGALIARGRVIDASRAWPGGNVVSLPPYAWQRQRYWLESEASARERLDGPRASILAGKSVYPLLGSRLRTAVAQWEGGYSDRHAGWMKHHQINGMAVVPGALFVELALEAAERIDNSSQLCLRGIAFEKPLFLDDNRPSKWQVCASSRGLEIYACSMSGDTETWHRHAVIRAVDRAPGRGRKLRRSLVEKRAPRIMDVAEWYRELKKPGYEYGPEFRRIETLRTGDRQALATIRTVATESALDSIVDPRIIDACFQTLLATAPMGENSLLLPVSIASVVFRCRIKPGEQLFVHAVAGQTSGRDARGDIRMFDAKGRIIIEFRGLVCRMMSAVEMKLSPENLLYTESWAAKARTGATVRVCFSKSENPANRCDYAVPEGRAPSRPPFTNPKEKTISPDIGRRLIVGGSELARNRLAAELNACGVETRCLGVGQIRKQDLAFVSGEKERGEIIVVADHADGKSISDKGYLPGRHVDVLEELLGLVNSLNDPEIENVPRLRMITCRAFDIGSGTRGVDPVSASLWGLVRSLRNEKPVLECPVTDIGSWDEAPDVEGLVEEITGAGPERETVFRNGIRYTSNIRRIEQADSDVSRKRRRFRVSARGSYLVTGGLSGFGLRAAEWLAEEGAGLIVLAGRRGPATPGAPEAVKRLEEAGSETMAEALDVTDGKALTALLERLTNSNRPLRGIIHAANVYADSIAARMTREHLMTVLKPKCLGAWNLHVASLEYPLDFFVLFGSMSSVIGNPGQGNYAAANAFLEGLNSLRREMGLPSSMVAWGPVDDIGRLGEDSQLKQRLTDMGIKPVSSGVMLSALPVILEGDYPSCIAADVNWKVLDERTGGWLGTKLAGESGPVSVEQYEPDEGSLVAILETCSEDERMDVIRKTVAGLVAGVMSIQDPASIDVEGNLFDMGMDSMMAMDLSSRLERVFGKPVPAMLLVRHSNVNGIVDLLGEKQ